MFRAVSNIRDLRVVETGVLLLQQLVSFDPVRLVLDLTVGQRLLQFGQARVADLVAAQREPLQLGHAPQVHQPVTSDPRSMEFEMLQVGQPRQAASGTVVARRS